MDKKIGGVMVTDEKHEKSLEEIIREGMRYHLEYFGNDATHAAVWDGHTEIPAIDGLIIQKKSEIQPNAALVGREIDPLMVLGSAFGQNRGN